MAGPLMPKNLVKPRPTPEVELALLREGCVAIAGVDEVGVGALAGPVAAAVVMFPLAGADAMDRSAQFLDALDGVRDSKQVRLRDQERLLPTIVEAVTPHLAISIVSVPELNAIANQTRAAAIASSRAIAALPSPPDVVLLDGNVSLEIEGMACRRVTKLLNGTPSLTIAAASIVANVTLRRIMRDEGMRYPEYGFERHGGNPSPAHLAVLATHGPSPIHHAFNALVVTAGKGRLEMPPQPADRCRKPETHAVDRSGDAGTIPMTDTYRSMNDPGSP